jgi:hypothetical protein
VKTCCDCHYFNSDDETSCRGEDEICHEFHSVYKSAREIVPDKETALELLIDAGIFNKDGTMNEVYKNK